MLEPLPIGYSGLVWPLFLAWLGLLVAFTKTLGFFIGVWYIILILEHLFVVFLFLGGAWYDTFDFRSNPSSLGVPGHACLARPWCSLESFLSALRDLPCTLFDSLLIWGNHLLQESLMELRTDWSRPYCLLKGGFLTLFVAFPLKELIGLIKALAELDRLDLPSVGIYFGS